MLKNITLALLGALSVNFTAKAQFSVDADSLWTGGWVEAFNDLSAHTNIRNTTADTLDIVWTRTLNNIPSGWSSAVCDISLCHGDTVNTAEFLLMPNSTGELSFHFYTSINKGIGKMVVRFARKSNPSYYIDIYINAQAYGLNILNVNNSALNIFPNPAVGSITIDSEKVKDGTFEIFNCLGEKMMSNQFSDKQLVDVSCLAKGIYTISVKNEFSVATTMLVIQ